MSKAPDAVKCPSNLRRPMLSTRAQPGLLPGQRRNYVRTLSDRLTFLARKSSAFDAIAPDISRTGTKIAAAVMCC
eukprot:8216661-Pyramimonas_sp.AAC.1